MSNNAMNFTKLMGNVYSELDFGFENLHANEELEQYMNELINKIELNRNSGEGTIDSSVIDLYNKILRLLKSCLPELTMSEAYDLVKIRRTAQSKAGKLKKADSNYIEELKKIHDDMESQVDECCKFISMQISALPSIKDFDDVFMQKIADCYLSKNDQTSDSNHAPASADYITRIVHRRLRKISPEFVCVKGGSGDRTDAKGYVIDDNGERILRSDLPSTKLLILKQFIKVFGWGEGVADTDEGRRGMPIKSPELQKYIKEKYDGSKEEASINIDETIFSEFQNAKHRGLFIVADRLANSKFGYTQFVREDIYIFSIAFKMSFSSDVRSNISVNDNDYETDIRKNLFFDYYCENLFNIDLNAKRSKRSSKDEKEAERSNRRKYIPGYGPNYRNYVEMIYIYFIERNDLSELKKLQNAKKLIKECRKSGKSIEILDKDDNDDLIYFQPTEYYRTTLFNEIKNKDYNDFKKYILENFVCKVENTEELDEERDRTISRMNVGAAHVTAADFYSNLLMSFEKKNKDVYFKKDKARIEYTGEDNRLHNLLDQFNDLCENENVLRRWYSSLDNAYHNSQLREGILEYDEHIVVNRTDLEVLLIDYLTVKLSELTANRKTEILSNFKSFYDYAANGSEFSILNNLYSGISSVLSACGYQEICSKNIFDIMLIYVTYKKCVANYL